MPIKKQFAVETSGSRVAGELTDKQIAIPSIPPSGLMAVGNRTSFNFVKEPWSAENDYQFYDVVRDNAGTSYIATSPVVPAGTPLDDEAHWFRWDAPNAQYNELYEITRTYDKRISDNTDAIADEVARATAAEGTKAPIDHVSEQGIYGIGNAGEFGHVRLTDDVDAVSGVEGGVAATPKMVGEVVKANLPNDVIVIGDSFSDSEYLGFNAWPTYFEQFTGMNVHNFAKANAGFNRSGTDGKNFLQQLVSANAAAIDKEQVKYVIVYGGYNDVANSVTPEQCRTAANQIIGNVNANYPNATLIVCLCTFGHRNALTDNYTMFAKRVGDYFRNANAIVISNAYAWLIGQPNDYTRDEKLHPSEKGSKFIAQLMTQAIHGSWSASAVFELDFENAFFTNDPKTKIALEHSGNSLVTIENGAVNISVYSFNWPQITEPINANLVIPIKPNGSNFTWNTNTGFGFACKTDLNLFGSYPNITGRTQYKTGYMNNGLLSFPIVSEGTGQHGNLNGDFAQMCKLL